MGASGLILPPQGYWAEVQEVLARHDILLFADEINCGFGRTSAWFACETYGIVPDMMTLAKQLTASVFPLSAVVTTDQVRDTIDGLAHDYQTLGHGVTYGGHPVGTAVALECLDIYQQMDVPTHTQRLGARITSHLVRLDTRPGVLDTRCQGMLVAVEFETNGPFGPDLARRIVIEAERCCVFFRIIGDVLAIALPYIITEDEIDTVMQILSDAIGSVTGSAP